VLNGEFVRYDYYNYHLKQPNHIRQTLHLTLQLPPKTVKPYSTNSPFNITIKVVIVVLYGEFVRYDLTVFGGNCSVKWRVCQIWFDCFRW
jgi:hypothetical protein